MLQLSICHGQKRVEEMEEEVLCVGAGVPVHICHVQLQGEETRTHRTDAARWIHCGLL